MLVNDDDLVTFEDVRVIRSAPPALLCAIGKRNIWLPRGHISGKLWCAGDRGKLLIRRWVARDRHLLDPILEPALTVAPDTSGRLRAVPARRRRAAP